MKTLLLLVLLCALAYGGYELVRIRMLIKKSAPLVAHATAFESTKGSRSILVLGDSTAVGVGSDTPEHTVAGRLATYLDASVENYAQSGAVTADIRSQLSYAQKGSYDFILLQIGANDIIRLHSVEETKNTLDRALAEVVTKSDRVILLTAGKVGTAPLFPRPFGWIWTNRAAHMREAFISTTDSYGVAYVDLFTANDPFSSDPARYYAADRLHLSGDGYGFWFEEVQKTLEATWPEFAHGE